MMEDKCSSTHIISASLITYTRDRGTTAIPTTRSELVQMKIFQPRNTTISLVESALIYILIYKHT